MYILWSIRANGWYSNGGAYTSDIHLAQKVDEVTAKQMTRLHYNKQMDEYGIVPVSFSLMVEVGI